MSIAILGGGLTGLTLGYLLKQKGIDFEIIEKEPNCGGLMRTIQEDGFTFDYGGSHILFSKDESVLNFMLELLGDNKIRNKRNTKVLYNGIYIKYPFENGLSELSKQENFECLYEFIRRIIMGPYNSNNFNDWCYNTFGTAITEKYLIPYNEKIWKFPTDKISTEWVERLPNPLLEDILKSSIGFNTEGYTHQLFFYYPRFGGIHSLIYSLIKGIEDNIITDLDIINIRREDEKWIISDGNRERVYDTIISTIPLPSLIKSLNIKGATKEAAQNLRYNSLITVMFGLDTENQTDYSWVYIPDKNITPHRISYPSNYSSDNAPKGKSSLLAEITCNIGDKIWSLGDTEIIDKVSKELHKEGIVDTSNICYSKVKRTKYAYVIYDLNHRKNVDLIKEYLKGIGIDIVGRFGEFEYLNMDGCIRHAIDYVNNKEKVET